MWQTGWLTNNSIYMQSLEKRLREYLDVPSLSVLSNGTIALQIAIKAMELKGEIITTPFSYVATTSSIVWESCVPVFADIEPDTYSISPDSILSMITPDTVAIMATHVYGNPCDVERIGEIAAEHGLKVIYDAAHAFGVKYNGRSVLNYGDVSTLSFHATKLFHTIEGGAVISPDPAVAEIMEYQRRFGHNGPYEFHGVGINAKISEPHAAMGHCVLDDMEAIMAKRKEQWLHYLHMLHQLPLKFLRVREKTEFNYAYFPVRFPDEGQLLKVLAAMENKEIFPRRYFFPSLNTLSYVSHSPCPESEDASRTVLCLPLYHDLTVKEQDLICSIIAGNL